MGGNLLHELVGLAGVQQPGPAAHVAPALLLALLLHLLVPAGQPNCWCQMTSPGKDIPEGLNVAEVCSAAKPPKASLESLRDQGCIAKFPCFELDATGRKVGWLTEEHAGGSRSASPVVVHSGLPVCGWALGSHDDMEGPVLACVFLHDQANSFQD